MKTFKLFPTRDSFSIEGDIETGILTIEGNSYNNDVIAVYQDFLIWFKNYMNHSKNCEIHLSLNYFNSATERIIYDMLIMLNKIKTIKPVKVIWSYEREDEDMKETGEVFKSIFGKIIIVNNISIAS